MTQGKILVFVEDPGAANFVAPLLPRLREAGFALEVCAVTKGAEHLAQMGESFDVPRTEVTASELVMHSEASALLVGTSENPDSLGLALVDAARAAGITSIGMVDGPANAAWRFRGRSDQPLAHVPEWILAADEDTRQAFISFGHSAERVLCVVHPATDHVVNRRRELERIDRSSLRATLFPGVGNRKVVVFVAEISDGLNPEQYHRDLKYTLHGRGGSDKRTDIVLEELLDAISLVSPRPFIALRLHPKNQSSEFNCYKDEIDLISAGGSPYELVFASDLVVGLSSRLLVEAAYLGRRVLSILPREEEKDWLPAIERRAITCVSNRIDVTNAVSVKLCGSDSSPEVGLDHLAMGADATALIAVLADSNAPNQFN